ncbi:MAG: ergothioneine biosynthesis protein EgtB [Gemmatimonadota bacterium]
MIPQANESQVTSQPGSEDGAGAKDGELRERIRAGLEATRRRTLDLIAPLSDAALGAQHSPLMSPILWDLGHIAEFEDLWLVRRLSAAGGAAGLARDYDASRTPRAERGGLALPSRAEIQRHLAEVRAAALGGLERLDPRSDDRLIAGGFVYDLVRSHEAQHQETILQTLVLMESEAYRPDRTSPPAAPAAVDGGGMVSVPAGPFDMGAPDGAFAYDNERPRHPATTGAYEIGRYPVSNGAYLEFVAAGGYVEPGPWTEEGRAWRAEAGLVAPAYWRPADADLGTPSAEDAAALAREEGAAGWARETSLGREPLDPGHPVVHVGFHEARAFAAWAGARLPTEAEWEKAAAWDPVTVRARAYPWGDEPPDARRGNLGRRAFGTTPLGAFPDGASALGCEQMLGDVWEWTASSFRGYSGFEAYPYEEYSAVFFGVDYRVLRGGSWATAPCAIRCSFRNWDYPIRRQIFAGLRLARDA